MRKTVDMQRITNNAMSKALLWQFWGNAALSGGLYGKSYVFVFCIHEHENIRIHCSNNI